jgi:hypothetical protein
MGVVVSIMKLIVRQLGYIIRKSRKTLREREREPGSLHSIAHLMNRIPGTKDAEIYFKAERLLEHTLSAAISAFTILNMQDRGLDDFQDFESRMVGYRGKI